jgi:hypothetical protein
MARDVVQLDVPAVPGNQSECLETRTYRVCAEPSDASAAAWLLIVCHQCFCPLPLLSCGLSPHIHTFQNLLDLHKSNKSASRSTTQDHKHALALGLDIISASEISQSTQFDIQCRLQHLSQQPEKSLPQPTAATDINPACETHALVACMVNLVATSISLCCNNNGDGGEAHHLMGNATEHPQGARRALDFQAPHLAGIMQGHASPEIAQEMIAQGNHGGFDAAVPWWLQQEQQAAADAAVATIASLFTHSARNVHRVNDASSKSNGVSQNSQESGSQTAASSDAGGYHAGGVPLLQSTLAWSLCSASTAAVTSIIPIICNRIILFAALGASKNATGSSSTQNTAFQPRVAATLLRWEGLWEAWMHELPENLATLSGIEALVACISDRDSCALTEPQHLVCLLLLKHALLCENLSMFLPLLPSN